MNCYQRIFGYLKIFFDLRCTIAKNPLITIHQFNVCGLSAVYLRVQSQSRPAFLVIFCLVGKCNGEQHMVAIIGGAELGLGTASGQVLGWQGQWGSALQGRSNEGVTVNAVTGNLSLRRQDEYLAGRGPDIGARSEERRVGEE